MTSAADFTYTTDGSYYTIYPENEIAKATVNAMIDTIGANKLLSHEFKDFKAQARRAGYTIRKAVAVTMSRSERDALLAELTETPDTIRKGATK